MNTAGHGVGEHGAAEQLQALEELVGVHVGGRLRRRGRAGRHRHEEADDPGIRRTLTKSLSGVFVWPN